MIKKKKKKKTKQLNQITSLFNSKISCSFLSFYLTQGKNQQENGHYLCDLFFWWHWSLVLLLLYRPHCFPSTTSGVFLSQGHFIYSSFHPGCPASRCFHGFFPNFLLTFTQTSPSQWGHLWHKTTDQALPPVHYSISCFTSSQCTWGEYYIF